MKEPSTTVRSLESLRRHYEIERELADRLRNAPPSDRPHLYRTVYNELFMRVPDHSQLSRKENASEQQQFTDRQMRLLRRFLSPDVVYMEIGPGDCHLAATVARAVRKVFALDVSDQIIGKGPWPANFAPVVFDGIQIDLPPRSIDVAYSHQLLEHLHPTDAEQQLRGVYSALAPGGVYVCTTPHRFSGPHDISKYFDSVARGFHLKEYTYGDLRRLFRRTGFSSTSAWAGVRGHYYQVPNFLAFLLEEGIRAWPAGLRKRLARLPLFRALFDSVTIVGWKSLTATD
jgi:SAM-dependent methyltransferase